MFPQPSSWAQKRGVLDYCNCQWIAPVGFVEDTALVILQDPDDLRLTELRV